MNPAKLFSQSSCAMTCVKFSQEFVKNWRGLCPFGNRKRRNPFYVWTQMILGLLLHALVGVHHTVVGVKGWLLYIGLWGCPPSQDTDAIKTAQFERYQTSTTYTLTGCFRRNAHHVLRQMLVETNNPGTHNENMYVANCRLYTFLWTLCK